MSETGGKSGDTRFIFDKRLNFEYSRSQLARWHIERNPSMIEIEGGADSISLRICTCINHGLPREEYDYDKFSKRRRHFGRNEFHWSRMVLDVFTFANKCRKAINKHGLKCTVIRFGEEMCIDWREVLVGDIVVLRKGQIIPADGILFQGDWLEVDEGLIYSTMSDINAIHIKSQHRDTILYAFTEVMKGEGRMLVTSVGDTSSLTDHLDTLQFAIKYGGSARAKKLFKKGVSPNVPAGRKGYMLIHWIAEQGTVSQMKLLLAQESEVNKKTVRLHSTALDLALAHNPTVARLLISSRKCDVNSVDIYGRSSLAYAARYASWDIVKEMIDDCGADVDLRDIYGWSPLMHAVARGKVETVGGLLAREDCNRQINGTDVEGNTCLIIAAVTGRVELVKMLLEAGADVNAANNAGRTALHLAVMGDMQPMFVHHGRRRQMVLRCGRRNVPRVRRTVVRDSGSRNSSMRNIFKTPETGVGGRRRYAPIRKERIGVHQNCYAHAKEIVQKLVDAGADVDVADIDGMAPIHYCLIGGGVYENNSFTKFVADLVQSQGRENSILRQEILKDSTSAKLLQNVDEDDTTDEDKPESIPEGSSSDGAYKNNVDLDGNVDDEGRQEDDKASKDEAANSNKGQVLVDTNEREEFFRSVLSLLITHGADVAYRPGNVMLQRKSTLSLGALKLSRASSDDKPTIPRVASSPSNIHISVSARGSKNRTATIVTGDLIKDNKEAREMIRRSGIRAWIKNFIFE